jgi:hypothetical protein
MSFPKPIRYDVDTWLIMRNDPVLPKAIITRQTQDGREYYRVVTWDLDPAQRTLVGRYASLEEANAAVRYDLPAPSAALPTGPEAYGAYKGPKV